MLSFPKSHKIENMIRFQFLFGNLSVYRGKSIKDFLCDIEHRLSIFERPTIIDSDISNTNITF